MKVYVVTSGTSSDYHIVGVFLDPKMAEVYCAIQHDGDPWSDNLNIEEYNTDDYFVTVRPEVKLHYEVQIDPASATEWDPDDVTICPTFITRRPFSFHRPSGWGDPGCYEAVLDTHDIDEIQKIFYDWLAQKKAEEAGL
jgi:hypothetical protein